MAFLLPALATVAGTAGSALISKLMNKIIGDAPLNEQTMSQVDTIMSTPASLLNQPFIRQMELQPDELNQIANYSIPDWQTAYTQSRGKLLGQIALPKDSAALAQAYNQSSNQLSQAVADGAALKQITPLYNQVGGIYNQVTPSGLHPIDQNVLNMQPQTAMQAALSSSLLGSRNNTASISHLPSNPINPMSLPLSAQQGRTPQSMIMNWSATPIQLAAQPQEKILSNQAVLTPSTFNTAAVPPASNPNFLRPTTVTGAIQGVASNAGNTFLGTAKDAAIDAVGKLGGQLVSQGSGAISKLIGNAANAGSKLLSNALSSIFGKIIGDAPPMRPEITQLTRDFPKHDLNSQLVSAVGQNAQSVMNTFMPKVIGDASLTKPMKVIGDANPMMTQPMKVVGDAPPVPSDTAIAPTNGGMDPGSLDRMGETMTDEQAGAAASNLQSSGAFALLTQLVLEEQTIHLAKGISTGLSPVQLNRQLGSMLEASAATFSQSQVSVVNGIQGAITAWPNIYSYGSLIDNTLVINVFNQGYRTICEIEPPAVAPPLGGNNTIDTLKPLLLGASISDYSSMLRVRTSTTNIDNMLRAFASAVQNIEGKTGYSFCLPLVKNMGYLLMKYNIPGENLNAITTGLNITYNENWSGGVSPYRVLPGVPGRIGDEVIKLAIITEEDYINILTGDIDSQTFDVEMTPDKWDVSCGVCFVRQQELTNWSANVLEMTSKFPFPMFMYVDASTTTAYQFDATNARQDFVLPTHCSKVVMTQIPGCWKAMLFVVLGAKTGQPKSIPIDPPNADGTHTYINTDDNTPVDPYETPINGDIFLRIGTWLGNVDSITSQQAFIRRWEEMKGNSSDRSCAMRFWAEHSRVYGPTMIGSNALHVGDNQSVAGISNAQYYSGNPAEPRTDFPMTNQPIWERSLTRWYSAASTGPYYNSLVWNNAYTSNYKTASGLQLTPTSLSGSATTVEAWNNSYGSAVVTVLPTEDNVVNFLVSKRWVYCMEEYPESLLNDASRLSFTIAIMNNIQAAITDLYCQSLDIALPLFYAPGLAASDQMVRQRLEKVVLPGWTEIDSSGIQFPVMYNRRYAMTNGADFITDPNLPTSAIYYLRAIYGDAVAGMSALTSVARIPRELMAAWTPLFQLINNKLRLNFSFANPSKTPFVVGTDRFDFLTVWLSVDDTKLSSVENIVYSRFVSRLAQGVVLNGTSTNPGFFVYNKLTNTLKLYLVNVRYADEGICTMINQSVGRGGLTQPITTTLGVPRGENILTRDPANSYSPLTLAMTGPLDAFAPGDGSFSYNMYYTNTGTFATYTTSHFTIIPEDVLSGSGIQHFLSSF
nr:MAG: ORF1 [Totiviridae sp.]